MSKLSRLDRTVDSSLLLQGPCPWLSASEPGWAPLDLPAALERGRVFSSRETPPGSCLLARYFRRLVDEAFVGKAYFGLGTEGPPGLAHNGSIGTLLDEALGGAIWLSGHVAFARHLAIDFLQRIPLGSEVLLEGKLLRREGRRIDAVGLLLPRHGEHPLARATAIYDKVDPASAGTTGRVIVGGV